MIKNWSKIYVRKSDLQLSPTLGGGQSFRWKNTEDDKWIGVFQNRLWVLSQTENYISYQCFEKSFSNQKIENCKTNYLNPSVSNDEKAENLLKSYFRLDFDLEKHIKIWSEADPYFRETAPKLFGIRILNQEVTENIFSFICSSNNNIKRCLLSMAKLMGLSFTSVLNKQNAKIVCFRISSMIEKLCENYGEPIIEMNNRMFYSFPAAEKLTSPEVESELRKAGFGYRAKFIHRSACMIEKLGGSVWLNNLKLLSYEDAKKELMKLPGIGAKVADCICLMSLGHLEAVPVDTHIFQVATKIHLPHLKKSKTLTDKIYNEIADHYRSLHGNYAGWANTILFCSDLKLLQPKKIKQKKRAKKGD